MIRPSGDPRKWIPASQLRTLARSVRGRVWLGWGVFAFLWPETVEALERIKAVREPDDRVVVAVLAGAALRESCPVRIWVPLWQRVMLADGLRDVDVVVVWRRLQPNRWVRRIGWSDAVVWLGPLEPLK